jgi:nitrate reductase NapE component
MILALSIEIPFEKYVTGEFSYFNIGLNIIIPPLLMFFLILSIKTPSRRNENLVVMEVIGLINKKVGSDSEIRLDRKFRVIFNFIFGLLYSLSFVATFGFIFWALNELDFSIISIIIFIAFISLISFAGTKIRKRAKELVVEKEKESFFLTLFDLFSLPVIQLGKWLSNQWSKHNAIAVLLNSLLDMPFQIFVEFLEQWRFFMKEKKEKIH